MEAKIDNFEKELQTLLKSKKECNSITDEVFSTMSQLKEILDRELAIKWIQSIAQSTSYILRKALLKTWQDLQAMEEGKATEVEIAIKEKFRFHIASIDTMSLEATHKTILRPIINAILNQEIPCSFHQSLSNLMKQNLKSVGIDIGIWSDLSDKLLRDRKKTSDALRKSIGMECEARIQSDIESALTPYENKIKPVITGAKKILSSIEPPAIHHLLLVAETT